MKRLTWISVVLFVIIAVTGSSWILRGFYDRIFMYEGHFHITSTASEDYDIELYFPSGQSYSFDLPSLGSHTFVMTETGEGSIQVVVDGKVREKVGYVTSINEICVLSIGDRVVVFSQLFPRSDARQGETSDLISTSSDLGTRVTEESVTHSSGSNVTEIDSSFAFLESKKACSFLNITDPVVWLVLQHADCL